MCPATKRRTGRQMLSFAWVVAYGAVVLSARQSPAQDRVGNLRATFASPPADARPMMRWWWFGPAVVKPELARELDAMHAAGIGGVELAAEYPLALDDPARGLVNLRYGSPAYVDMLRFAAVHARSLGMRVDLTLGSGWPFGGPEIPIGLAAGRLKVVAVTLPSAASAIPRLGEGEAFIAAFTAPGTPEHFDAAHAQRLPLTGLPAALERAADGTVELFFIASHTRQQVKRAAFGGEGFVLDHMAKAAIEQHLHVVGDALLSGFAEKPPFAVFSDSLEAYGSDWTPDLPAEFARRRGYDLLPHLPELVQGGTPEADAVRHDWGVTLSDLVRDNYLHPVAEYAAAHGTRFRSQTYGEPAVTLADEVAPQLPEGEGPQWRAFSYTRWASSANHVYGNPVTSAETWTWLHSPAWRATPLDMKAEADRMFLEGVNQIIGHGFPYSAPGMEEPGWSLYAAAALNDHNPWWPVMPDVMRYLTRVSWTLRQGEPVQDVAVLLPEDDAQAAFRPGHVSVTEEMPQHITPALMAAILDSGHSVDYIDLSAVGTRGLHYPALVVPSMRRLPLSGLRALEAYQRNGGKLIFLGEVPSVAPGLRESGESKAVREGVQKLLKLAVLLENEAGLSSALARTLPPDLTLGEAAGKLGFLHRRLAGADVYFIANTTPNPVSWRVKVASDRAVAEWWDADTGRATTARLGMAVEFAPYSSRLLVLHDRDTTGKAPAQETRSPEEKAPVVLQGWTMTFPGNAGSAPRPAHTTVSDTLWTDTAGTRFYSGEVRYTTTFHAVGPRPHEALILQFAPGEALPEFQAANKPGMRAWYNPPIHEAALVLVNGKQAGALWHPPYELDLSGLVKPGTNTIELRVFNTAMNELSAQPTRDYTALKAHFGDRFQMQDMDHLEPVPSGIVGPVKLVYENTH